MIETRTKLLFHLDIPRLMSALTEAHTLFHTIRDAPGKVCVQVLQIKIITVLTLCLGLHYSEAAGSASTRYCC